MGGRGAAAGRGGLTPTGATGVAISFVSKDERDYLRAVRADETGWGAAFNASRQLASNLSTDFTLSYNDYERSFDLDAPQADTSGDQDWQAIARLNRQSGEKLTLSAEAGYLTRSGDSDYDGWWTGLRARWTP